MSEWSGSKTLKALTGTVVVACDKCGQSRSREVSDLIMARGLDLALPDLPAKVFLDCPKREGQYFDRCGARLRQT